MRAEPETVAVALLAPMWRVRSGRVELQGVSLGWGALVLGRALFYLIGRCWEGNVFGEEGLCLRWDMHLREIMMAPH